MATKISGLTPLHQTTLPKSDQHKESSFLRGLGRGSYSLSPFETGMGMVMGFFPFPMHLGCFRWSLSCCAETCCVNSIRTHDFRWNGELRWVGEALSNLKMLSQLLLSRWRRWHAAVLFFFSKINHGVGSTSSRYAVYFSLALVSDFMGPTNWLSSAIQMLGWLVFGLQLSSSVNPIVFRPNNHIINIFWVMGYMWVSFGLINSVEIPL